ncbi:MAG TPA: DUF1553 domain-containing protein [Bryobacteraceae bacterium]|nr:DUF1553 domain-containing protein [Bryobacteraceae bacterium]
MWKWPALVALGSVLCVNAAELPPVLTAKCAACHSEKAKASDFVVSDFASIRKGGKKHGVAVVGGHPEKSPLFLMIKGDLAPRMPMGGELSAEEIASVEAWIKGLPEDKPQAKAEWRWPYEKPAKPAVPAISNPALARNEIDNFILAKLSAKGLAPAAPASKRTLARRVYFDLLGLPPSPTELDAFLSDNSSTAYEKLIDKLLADPRYGERWGRHWLDLVRYGETSGLEGDGAIGNAWRYRDWVVQAFNDDMPYNRFVVKQLAGGDEHSKTRNNYQPDVQGHVPLGYYRVAPWDRSNLVADEVRANYLSEITTTTSSVFLGLTLGCAKCHDHKYDPFPQKDFYRFQAFFNAIQVQNVDVPYKDEAFRAKAEEKIKALQALLKEGPEKKALDQMEKDLLPKFREGRRKLAAARPLAAEDVRLEMRRKDSTIFSAAERMRHAELKEDADRTLDPDEKKALDEYEQPMLARLREAHAKDPAAVAKRFDVLTVEELRNEIGRSSSKIFNAEERDKHRELDEKLDTYRRRLGRWQPNALSIQNVPGPPNGPAIGLTHVLVRGDYRQPGEAVEAGFLSAITGKSEPAVIEQDRYRQFPTRGLRLTLAKWIASPENPLTARVMVNRIWQNHFGTGIVATPSDFGVNGERPTHPELLDWMSHKFIESGWSVKAMHRLILQSATYRQSAENKNAAADADAKLLSRFPRRRLQAEEIRDGILYLSDRLNAEQGGPSVFPPLPADLADFARYGRGGALMWETNESEADTRRRSIYTFQRRSMPLPMMAAFDAPVFSESCDRRSATTTPLQALSLMNGNLMHEETQHLAALIAKEAGGNKPTQVRVAFQRILNRPPTPEETDRFASFPGSLDALCRVLLNSNEFLFVE